MNKPAVTSVLFVCMGNICRSPSAEGVFKRKVGESGLDERVRVDSAGTHAYHLSEVPDARAQAATMARGIDISHQRARRFDVSDFERFDYILAMDQDNLDILLRLCPAKFTGKLDLLLSFAPRLNCRDVPDPYYGGEHGFERVLDLIEQGCAGLLDELRANLG
jgi:protein-tyrosine phosphatase